MYTYYVPELQCLTNLYDIHRVLWTALRKVPFCVIFHKLTFCVILRKLNTFTEQICVKYITKK